MSVKRRRRPISKLAIALVYLALGLSVAAGGVIVYRYGTRSTDAGKASEIDRARLVEPVALDGVSSLTRSPNRRLQLSKLQPLCGLHRFEFI